MKELSIEEKARAYDRVSKEVKDFFEGKQKMYSDVEQTLEYLFPDLKESEDEKAMKDLLNFLKSPFVKEHICDWKVAPWIAWLEKQGEQEQLYIRFGEIPTDEKSKIFQGEIEVGTENGVSVYPAFKTSEGDIVLGLSLPITKTTLYTQQHLIEYDDRPCYLVRGDYVGKDTDGQPLINNVSIIEKIDTYRVKEKKQREQKLAWSEEDKKLTDVNHEYFSELLENNNSKDINDYAYQVAYCMSHDWANETPTWDNVQKACKLGAEWNEKHHKSTWSEEDENILKSIHNSIDVECLLKNGVEYLGMVYWLKSLKDRVQPQNTWKPSDEQMEALWNTLHPDDPFYVDLSSLYNDLKKLTEE